MAKIVKYNYLGNSGLKVSNICYGAMTFGENKIYEGVKQNTEEEAHKILDRFAELGGNFIDTANVYQHGKSEEIIGNWLAKQKRENFIIATKVRFVMTDDPNGRGLSRVHILKEVEDSLKRLKTSYIDLYQIHMWDAGVPIEETLSALNDLVRAGKIRYIGASNLTGWQLQKIVEINKTHGWDRWVSLQQQYNLLCRQSELEIVDVCRNEGIGIIPWSPLKGGVLSGKLKRDGKLESGSRMAYVTANPDKAMDAAPSFDQVNNDKTWNLLDVMEKLAKKHGKTVAQVAIRWILEKDFIPSVIIGAKNIKQLEDNMGAASGWELTKEDMESLDKASEYEIPYPYAMQRKMNADRERPGHISLK